MTFIKKFNISLGADEITSLSGFSLLLSCPPIVVIQYIFLSASKTCWCIYNVFLKTFQQSFISTRVQPNKSETFIKSSKKFSKDSWDVGVSACEIGQCAELETNKNQLLSLSNLMRL